MDYTPFTTEELVLDGYFQRWVNQQLPPEDCYWEEWLSLHPEKQEEVKQAKFILEALRMENHPLDGQSVNERVEKILESLDEKPVSVRRSIMHSPWLRLAAMLVIVCGFGWYFWTNENKNEVAQQPIESTGLAMVEKVNNSDQPIKLSLSDGSMITLQPKSSLNYPETFLNDKREVYLSGEARFDVAKDAQKPFLVHSEELTTKVLGTVFTIRAFKTDRDITVKVYSGRVTVLAGKETVQNVHQPFNQNEGVVLTPNQMAVFDRKPERLIKTLVENPIILSQPEASTDGKSAFFFDNTPVNLVFDALEKSYGVTIVHDREVLDGCTVTAPLGNETLYEKLDLVCKVIRATYQVVDGQVIVSSKGCK